MIELTDGWAVERLLRRAYTQPETLSNVVICAPFIDGRHTNILVALACKVRNCGCSLTIVTTPSEAARLNGALLPARTVRVNVVGRRRLHAKIYIIEGHDMNDSEAIVTSANLTNAGLHCNTELGVRAIPTTEPGRRLYNETLLRVNCDIHIVRARRTV